MESTTHGENKCALRTGLFESRAGFFHSLTFTRNHELSGAVVVSRYHHLAGGFARFGTNLFDHIIFESDDGCHRSGTGFAGSLHGHGTLRHKAQTIFEAKTACRCERRQFAERVAAYHIGLKFCAEATRADHTVQKDGGLRHLCLLEFLIGTGKHDIGDAET